jgi:WD40 repeat protein
MPLTPLQSVALEFATPDLLFLTNVLSESEISSLLFILKIKVGYSSLVLLVFPHRVLLFDALSKNLLSSSTFNEEIFDVNVFQHGNLFGIVLVNSAHIKYFIVNATFNLREAARWSIPEQYRECVQTGSCRQDISHDARVMILGLGESVFALTFDSVRDESVYKMVVSDISIPLSHTILDVKIVNRGMKYSKKHLLSESSCLEADFSYPLSDSFHPCLVSILLSTGEVAFFSESEISEPFSLKRVASTSSRFTSTLDQSLLRRVRSPLHLFSLFGLDASPVLSELRFHWAWNDESMTQDALLTGPPVLVSEVLEDAMGGADGGNVESGTEEQSVERSSFPVPHDLIARRSLTTDSTRGRISISGNGSDSPYSGASSNDLPSLQPLPLSGHPSVAATDRLNAPPFTRDLQLDPPYVDERNELFSFLNVANVSSESIDCSLSLLVYSPTSSTGKISHIRDAEIKLELSSASSITIHSVLVDFVSTLYLSSSLSKHSSLYQFRKMTDFEPSASDNSNELSSGFQVKETTVKSNETREVCENDIFKAALLEHLGSLNSTALESSIKTASFTVSCALRKQSNSISDSSMISYEYLITPSTKSSVCMYEHPLLPSSSLESSFFVQNRHVPYTNPAYLQACLGPVNELYVATLVHVLAREVERRQMHKRVLAVLDENLEELENQRELEGLQLQAITEREGDESQQGDSGKKTGRTSSSKALYPSLLDFDIANGNLLRVLPKMTLSLISIPSTQEEQESSLQSNSSVTSATTDLPYQLIHSWYSAIFAPVDFPSKDIVRDYVSLLSSRSSVHSQNQLNHSDIEFLLKHSDSLNRQNSSDWITTSLRSMLRASSPLGRSESSGLDFPGKVFLHQASFARQKSIDKSEKVEPKWASFLWALFSETQDILLRCCLPASPSWEDVRIAGVPFWLRSDALLREMVENVAKTTYIAADKDPFSVLLLYTALGLHKLPVIRSLFRLSPQHQKVFTFLQSDFTDENVQRIASKNAFALLSQHRYEAAAGFFFLAKRPSQAINVAITQMKDLPLAFLLARLARSSSSSTMPLGSSLPSQASSIVKFELMDAPMIQRMCASELLALKKASAAAALSPSSANLPKPNVSNPFGFESDDDWAARNKASSSSVQAGDVEGASASAPQSTGPRMDDDPTGYLVLSEFVAAGASVNGPLTPCGVVAASKEDAASLSCLGLFLQHRYIDAMSLLLDFTFSKEVLPSESLAFFFRFLLKQGYIRKSILSKVLLAKRDKERAVPQASNEDCAQSIELQVERWILKSYIHKRLPELAFVLLGEVQPAFFSASMELTHAKLLNVPEDEPANLLRESKEMILEHILADMEEKYIEGVDLYASLASANEEYDWSSASKMLENELDVFAKRLSSTGAPTSIRDLLVDAVKQAHDLRLYLSWAHLIVLSSPGSNLEKTSFKPLSSLILTESNHLLVESFRALKTLRVSGHTLAASHAVVVSRLHRLSMLALLDGAVSACHVWLHLVLLAALSRDWGRLTSLLMAAEAQQLQPRSIDIAHIVWAESVANVNESSTSISGSPLTTNSSVKQPPGTLPQTSLEDWLDGFIDLCLLFLLSGSISIVAERHMKSAFSLEVFGALHRFAKRSFRDLRVCNSRLSTRTSLVSLSSNGSHKSEHSPWSANTGPRASIIEQLTGIVATPRLPIEKRQMWWYQSELIFRSSGFLVEADSAPNVQSRHVQTTLEQVCSLWSFLGGPGLLWHLGAELRAVLYARSLSEKLASVEVCPIAMQVEAATFPHQHAPVNPVLSLTASRLSTHLLASISDIGVNHLELTEPNSFAPLDLSLTPIASRSPLADSFRVEQAVGVASTDAPVRRRSIVGLNPSRILSNIRESVSDAYHEVIDKASKRFPTSTTLSTLLASSGAHVPRIAIPPSTGAHGTHSLLPLDAHNYTLPYTLAASVLALHPSNTSLYARGGPDGYLAICSAHSAGAAPQPWTHDIDRMLTYDPLPVPAAHKQKQQQQQQQQHSHFSKSDFTHPVSSSLSSRGSVASNLASHASSDSLSLTADLSSLDNLDNEMLRVRWSPDGSQLASAFCSGVVRVWDASHRNHHASKPVSVLSTSGAHFLSTHPSASHPGQVISRPVWASTDLAFLSHSGKLMAVSAAPLFAPSPDGSEPPNVPLGPGASMRNLKIDDLMLLGWGLHLFDVRASNASIATSFKYPAVRGCTSIAYDADSLSLLIGCEDGSLHVYDLRKGAERMSVPGVHRSSFGTSLTSLGTPSTSTGLPRTNSVPGALSSAASVASSAPTPSGIEGPLQKSRPAIAMRPSASEGTLQQSIQALELSKAPALALQHSQASQAFLGHFGAIMDIVVHPSRKFFATSGRDGDVRLWSLPDLARMELVTNVHSSKGAARKLGGACNPWSVKGGISGLQFLCDPDRIVSSGYDGKVVSTPISWKVEHL